MTDEGTKKDRQKRTGRNVHTPTATGNPFPDEPSTISVLVPSAHYPTPQDLKVGSTATDIRSQFGEPSARVSGVRESVLLERYYYLNEERTKVTVATFENGVLVSAQDQLR